MATIFELPQNISAEELAGDSVLLRGAGEGAESASWDGVRIPGLNRFLALSLESHFVTAAAFGESLAEVPDRCQFLLWEGDGGYGALVPLLHEDYRTEMEGTAEGLRMKASCDAAGRKRTDVALALGCVREDPYEAVRDGLASAVKWMARGRLRTEKRTPGWIDYLGWCTWDAFYTEVNEKGVLEGLAAFRKGGIVPGFVIIDEGWQDYNAKNYLMSYGVKAGAFTGDNLKHVTSQAKEEYGVRMMGCWRTLFGELRGVDVESPGLNGLGRRLVHEPGTVSDTFGVVEPEDVPRFHEEYAAKLAQDGIDFIKVDFQSALHLMTYAQCGRAEAARIWQHAVQESVEKHFHGEMLNCMSMGSDEVYHTRASNVCRASNDFYPGKGDSHPAHVRANMYNALWLGQMEWPDWDMFQSGHPWALYHATARAVSGGPVYVSDKVGASDYELLKRMVAADGKILRCPQPGLVTRDSLFRDPVAQRRLMTVQNRCGQIGLLGVFHPMPEGEELRQKVSADQVEGLEGRQFAVYSTMRGFLGVEEHVELSLKAREADILVFSPVTEGIALFGLIEKLNPAAAISDMEMHGTHCRFRTRGGGTFGFYARGEVRGVRMDGADVPFKNIGGMITFDTGKRLVCAVDIEA